MIGCSGGDNLAGVNFPFIKDKIEGRKVRVVAVEPTSCPKLTNGDFCYDFGDLAGLTPLLKMYTLGHDFVTPGIHAAIDEAELCKQEGKAKAIFLNLSGHGNFDMQAYADCHSGKIEDFEYLEGKIKEFLSRLHKV